MTPTIDTAPPRRRPRGDEGSVTLFFAITVIGLLVLIGLVVDGGAKIRAIQHADSLAADAARVAGQQINAPAAITGADPRVDARAAVAAAQRYLSAHGVTGTVTASGPTVTVEVTSTTPTIFLGLIGITTLTVHGHANATLVRGITGATP